MKSLLLTMLLAGTVASAADIVITDLSAAAPLAGEWKRQLGDDPRWSDPNFDDSSWTSVNMPQPVAPGPVGFQWHRLHVVLPDDQPHHLLLAPLYPAYEIFVNGQRIGSFGTVGTRTGQLYAEPMIFALPSSRRMVIAIRSYDINLLFGRQSASTVTGTSWIASRSVLEGKQAQWALALAERSALMRVVVVMLIAGGLFFMVTSLWRRKAEEYLWGGSFIALLGLLRILQNFPQALGWTNRFAVDLTASLGDAATVVTWVLFCKTFFQSNLTRTAWAAAGLQMVCAIFNAQPVSEQLPSYAMAISNLIWHCSTVIVYLSCLAGRRHASRQSYWPLNVGVLCWMGANFVFSISAFLSSEQFFSDTVSPLEVAFRSAVLFFELGLGIALNQRAGERDREQDRLQSEMAAASEVQSLLLSSAAPDPQYEITSIYYSASEVGGDFYQIAEREDGSKLVIVGDVSGKGLKAAMLVSVALGALGATRSSSPSLVLASLNDSLFGRVAGGFVTCCCVRLGSNGDLTIANAGHLAPYRNGHEIEMEAGLPLGLIPGGICLEITLQLLPGDQLTLISDGVLEAENENKELFGFDQTRQISTKSAQVIADAARAWGQTDDITVVTVRRPA